MYEFGSRVGFWRLMDLFAERKMPLTVFACALALERNPEAARAIVEAGHDVCCHGWRWVQHWLLSEEEERRHIRMAIVSLKRTLGERPLGWYCRTAPDVNTRRLLVEEGGFLYDSDAYDDELPYWVNEGGKPMGAHKVGWHWHTDLTYFPKPCDMTMLLGVEIPPEGGDTFFCSLTAAYDSLSPADKKRVDGMRAVHSYNYMRAIKYPDAAPLSQEQLDRVKDIEQPLVRTHPVTGRRALYVSEYIIRNIVGMDIPESQAFLAEMIAHATEDRFVYQHRWQVGDLIFWDNRATMHKATPYDDVRYKRRMHRSMTAGDVPF